MSLHQNSIGLVLAAALAALVPVRAAGAPARDAQGTTARLHLDKGVKCADCHGAAKTPAHVTAEPCLSCHGPYEQLAEKTAKLRPLNPHASPHWGADIECAVCHRQHASTRNWCAHCHTVENKAP